MICMASALLARVPTALDDSVHQSPNRHGTLSPLPPSAHLLQLSGTPSQRGFAHGYLLEPQIIDWCVFYLLQYNMHSDVAWYERIGQWWLDNQFVPLHIAEEVEGVLKGMAARAGDRNETLHIEALGRSFTALDLHLMNAYLEATPNGSAITAGPFIGAKQQQQARRQTRSGGTAERSARPACSQFVVWGAMTSDGHAIAARNMDGETDPQYVTVNDVLVQAVAGEGERRFVSVMWPGHVGGLSLMNEDGLYLMLNVGSMGRGGVATNVTAIEYVMRGLVSSLSSADATAQRVSTELGRYRGSLGGVSASGTNIVFARKRPKATATQAEMQIEEDGEDKVAALGFVAELDRYQSTLRLPSTAHSNLIAATNHFVSHGVNASADPSDDPQSPWQNFGVPVGHETYWRYEALLSALRSRARNKQPIAGLADAASLLQRAAHGTTEHSVAFAPERLEIALAIANPRQTHGRWDAPYGQWTTYAFSELFAPRVTV